MSKALISDWLPLLLALALAALVLGGVKVPW
jgi:hypothetical protein